MEDLKSYMASGVLELYVIGELTGDDRQEVERMASEYPEIKDELGKIERAIEKYAQTYAVDPGEKTRDRILSALELDEGADQEIVAADEATVVRMIPSSPFYKYAFAASIALLLLSWGSLFVVYKRLQDSNQTIVALQSSNQQFASNASFVEKQLAQQREIVSVFTNPDFKFISLAAPANAPAAGMKVAFNQKAEEVLIDLSSISMPANDSEHQYQLWALVDGKPVDLGVFDKLADGRGLKKMKAIGHLQTFAVTLEPRGGSVNPTLTELKVLGNI